MLYNQARKDAIKLLQKKEDEYNALAGKANDAILVLYEKRQSAVKAIERVESYINSLANVPVDFQKDVTTAMNSIKSFNEAVKYAEAHIKDNITGGSISGGGILGGAAIATMGPSAAMACATTFGVASTGAPIASLSGAAATNAALAWLGGGTVAAGGGGMAAGNAFLALAGPVGLTVAGVLAIGGGALVIIKNKKQIKQAYESIKKYEENIAFLKPKFKELSALNDSTNKLKSTLGLAIFKTYPTDFEKFSEAQREHLTTIINNTKALGALINKRI